LSLKKMRPSSASAGQEGTEKQATEFLKKTRACVLNGEKKSGVARGDKTQGVGEITAVLQGRNNSDEKAEGA